MIPPHPVRYHDRDMRHVITIAVFVLATVFAPSCGDEGGGDPAAGDAVTDGPVLPCTEDPSLPWESPEDGQCNVDAWYDPDCKDLDAAGLHAAGFDSGADDHVCDRNPTACDAAFRCTTDDFARDAELTCYAGQHLVVRPCPNDPDCGTVTEFACALDGFCDPWCPCNLDGDCTTDDDCCADAHP